MTGAELKALRTPLAALAVAAIVGAAVVYYTGGLLLGAQRELDRQQLQLREAVSRLQKSGEERQLIVRYLDDYRKLQRAGFIGDEQRINWLDGLRLANQQTELFGVDYQISAQRQYPYAAEFDPGRLALNQSVMRLRFRLLHAEDLTRFFSTLARVGAGVFLLDECTLTRTETGAAIRYQPNLVASCELSWITARTAAERKP